MVQRLRFMSLYSHSDQLDVGHRRRLMRNRVYEYFSGVWTCF